MFLSNTFYGKTARLCILRKNTYQQRTKWVDKLDKIFFMRDNIFMKTLLSLAIFALSVFAPNSSGVILASKCPLLSAPDFSSAIVQYQEEDYYLTLNQEIEVLETYGDFVKVKTQEDLQGYVYKYYITQNTSLDTYPVFNCQVRANTLIYDLNKQPTTYVATKNSRVFIFNGFDKIEGGYTQVQVVLENGDIYSGLIKSSDLKPDGINRSAIIAIPIILAGVTVILSIVFIEKKKRKKKKSKANKKVAV